MRPPRSRDCVAALVASAVACALVFQLAPAILRELRLADRFDAAIVAVTPALIAGDFVGRDGQWSRRLREASDVVGELELAMDVDRDNRLLVLRAPVALMAADSGQPVLDPPSVRLERKGVTAETATWSCTDLGLAFYAQPSRCRDMPRSSSGLAISPEAMANIP